MLRNIRLFKGPLISILCAAAEVSNLDQICTVPPTEVASRLLSWAGLLLLLGWPADFGRGANCAVCAFRL